MKTGLGAGARGSDVVRLHRVLSAVGHSIAAEEVARQVIGPSTLTALHTIQRDRGRPVVDEIDTATLEILLRLEDHHN